MALASATGFFYLRSAAATRLKQERRHPNDCYHYRLDSPVTGKCDGNGTRNGECSLMIPLATQYALLILAAIATVGIIAAAFRK